MRGFLILILICFLFIPQPANAFFQKKDYKQIFLDTARNAEKRNNNKSAFHSYEKAMYYYSKDKNVVEDYAEFCERQKYFDKAQKLYEKLYVMTKDKKYLYKRDLCIVKNGKLSDLELEKLLKKEYLTSVQKNQLNQALVFHYSYKDDWLSVKKTCDKIPKNSIGRDSITTCIVASERVKDKKNALDYYLRYSELYPEDSSIINKIIELEEKFGNYAMAEKFTKKLIVLNPNDNGIKYRLAGEYEKQGDWAKAAKIYELLMTLGDKSEHVKNSYAYDITQLKNKNTPRMSYAPKPLSGFKLYEKNFYEAWRNKNYAQAEQNLSKMLKEQPQNAKLLRHRVELAMEQEKYADSIVYFENLQKIKPLSLKDEENIAFLYSKTGNYSKAIEITENLLKKSPNDKSLLKNALEYTYADKNWDKAIFYTDKLLVLEPDSEVLLKGGGDLYSAKEEFITAASYYEKLVDKHPKIEYKMDLANLYMAGKEFDKAESLLYVLYNQKPNDSKVIKAYLNSLMAQQKLNEAYGVVLTHNLQYTKEGYIVLGDLAAKDKKYEVAEGNYYGAYLLAPNDLVVQNKLAFAYRMTGYSDGSEKIYNKMLMQDPQNKEARIGLGSLEIDKKNYDKARRIFTNVLREDPDYRPAKIAMAHSYIANDEKFAALDILNQIPEDDESKLMKAQAYYDMSMWSDSKKVIKGSATKDAEALKYKIRRDNAITITPNYTFMVQNLAEQFNLDLHKFGMNVSQNVNDNTNVFMEYNVIVYSSGGPSYRNNVVNEFRGGVQGRPTEKWAYRADIGVRAFEFGGALINTDSWIQHFFNDKFNLRLGFRRNNIEQSYLSAVGGDINGVFTGRSIDNKVYLEYEAKLPHQCYSFGRGAYGAIYSANLITNQYYEGMVGVGRLLYNNPKNKWLNVVAFDIVSYNAGYQYNQLKIYDSSGNLYGGYFSPGYFSANTGNIKVEGNIKKWHLKYGIKAFGGIQTSVTPDQTTPTWGYAPYISYDINDNVAINASYSHYNYADIQRDIFTINAVIRGFDKHAKN